MCGLSARWVWVWVWVWVWGAKDEGAAAAGVGWLVRFVGRVPVGFGARVGVAGAACLECKGLV